MKRLVSWVVLAVVAIVSRHAVASGVEPTRLSLPSGPASIEGLGRSFEPSLSTGTASYGIDIAVPPAAGGLAPRLSLDYDSGGGVSELGMGWRLGGVPAIRRRVTDGLPRFDTRDTFEVVGLGANSELLEVGPGVFRPEIESGAFVRVQRSEDGERWEVRVKSGRVFRFGGEGYTEAEDGDVVTYLLREELDLHGHRIRYEWDTREGHALLERVIWNDFSDEVRQELVFDYEAQPDVHELFSSGIRQVISKRLATVEVLYGGALVRRYSLAYRAQPHSRLERVTLVGTDGETALPTLSFEYTEPSFATKGQVIEMQEPPGRSPGEADVALADLDGDSLPDLLVAEAGNFRSYVNRDGRSWEGSVRWEASPSVSLSTEGAQLGDVNGDGAIDLLVTGGSEEARYFPGESAARFGWSVSMEGAPSFSFEDPEVRLADFDGDRRVDAAMTTEAGLSIAYNLGGDALEEPVQWAEAVDVGVIDERQELRFSDEHVSLCDVNGDRVQDFCYLRSGSLMYWLGRGRGRFEAARQGEGVPDFEEETEKYRLLDLNGDGWVDLVHVGVARVFYALAEGAGVFGELETIEDTPESGPEGAVEFADMNGSGTTDIVWVDVSNGPEKAWQYLELFPDGRGGLLSTIDNGLGKVVTIEYESAARFAAEARSARQLWSSRQNVALPVVSRVTVDSSLGDPLLVTEYAYREGTWDPKERTFAGFASGVSEALGDEFTPTLVSESWFELGLEHRALRGAVLMSEARDEDGGLFRRTVNEYRSVELEEGLDGRRVEYGYKASERVAHVELDDEQDARTTLTEWQQDRFGNVVEERRWGEVEGDDKLMGNDEAITRTTYAINERDWLVGFVATRELLNAKGERVALERNYYDGEAFEGLPLGEVARGDLSRSEAWVGPGEGDFELSMSTRYNQDGQPVETRDARGGGRFYEWDAEDHTTLLSERVKLESEFDLTEEAVTDRRFGNLLSAREYNGEITRFAYDALGRLTAIFKPGDQEGKPTVSYEYQHGNPLSRVVTKARFGSGPGDFEETHTLTDGLGRKRGALTRADDDHWVLAGVTLLDERGEAWRSLRPRFVAAESIDEPPVLEDHLGVTTFRDALGRERRTLTELGREARTDYEPLIKKTRDPGQTDDGSEFEQTPTIEEQDGLGRLVRATKFLDGEAIAAVFSYDAVGNLLSKTDPEGNTSRYEYDGRGRRIVIDDPDVGRHEHVYDATGNLIERHRPDGSVLRYKFDLAGRPLSEDWNDDGEPEVTKTWDVRSSEPENRSYRGKLARIEHPAGLTEHEYDPRGRVVWTHLTLEGERYSTGSLFDQQDREVRHYYPDGSSIAIGRNLRGQLSDYAEGTVRIDYRKDGLEELRTFATGVLQTTKYDEDQRQTELRIVAADGADVERLSWGYDAANNLTSLDDLRQDVSPELDRSESYRYDNLYRLTGARGSWGETRWSYSPSGNLLERHSGIAEQHTEKLAYGDAAGPHAVTRMDDRRLSYDPLGRLRDDGERQLTYNEADQLVRVETNAGATVESVFDGDGQRRIRRSTSADGTEDTLISISPWSEVRNGKLVRYIVHADRRIVKLADRDTGAPPEAAPSIVSPIADQSPGQGLRRLPQMVFGVSALLMLALCSALRRRRRWLAPLVAALVVASCREGGRGGDQVDQGTTNTTSPAAEDSTAVTALTEEDRLLFTDQLGSTLVETNAAGEVQARFASYPFGAPRYDSSEETRAYANAPRDRSVGLDLMGARFYAPDLGFWTQGDPLAIDSPEQAVGAEFATANPYAYANLTPVCANDPNGEFWHVVVGGGIGALVGGGIEAARQYYTNGKVEDWGRVKAAAAGGAVSGIVQTAVPGTGTAVMLAVGGGSAAAAGVTERLVESGGKSAGTLTDVAIDIGVGTATAGLMRGGSKVVQAIRAPKAPQVKLVATQTPSGSAAKRAIPELPRGPQGQMFQAAVDILQASPASEKVRLMNGFSSQIESASSGAWKAKPVDLADGSTAFVGDAGRTMVITREGRMFSGPGSDAFKYTDKGIEPALENMKEMPSLLGH